MVRRLQVDGTELDGIHYLRAFGNADAIRATLDDAEHVVCVGGSYIGCEVAASLRAIGKQVTIVMLEDEPMERGFGARSARSSAASSPSAASASSTPTRSSGSRARSASSAWSRRAGASSRPTSWSAASASRPT